LQRDQGVQSQRQYISTATNYYSHQTTKGTENSTKIY